MVTGSSKNTVIAEAFAASFLSFAVIVLAVEIVNRNKPEKYTQEEKMRTLGVTFAVSLGAYLITKKVFEK